MVEGTWGYAPTICPYPPTVESGLKVDSRIQVGSVFIEVFKWFFVRFADVECVEDNLGEI